MYFTHVLHDRVQRDPQAVFSVYEDRTTTVAATIDRVSRIAGWLRSVGVQPDDRVAFLDVNTDSYLQVALAVSWADAIQVPVNYRWSVAEMVYSLEEAGVRVLVVGDRFLPLVDDIREAMPSLEHIAHLGDAETPQRLIRPAQLLAAEPVDDARRQGDALLGLFYTGGTTGYPKGVMLDHRSLFLGITSTALEAGYLAGGTQMVVMPAFHLGGAAAVVQAMVLRRSIVMVPEFDPLAAMRIIEKYRVTDTALVPTMIQMVVDHPECVDYDLSSLRCFVYGAAPISEALMDRARAVFTDAKFVQIYGMTELSAVTTILLDADHAHPQRRKSVGRPAFHSPVRVLDGGGQELPRGAVGEICVQGEHMMQGYWAKPEQTAEAIRDGWMHTGDGGYVDDDGYVYLVDRLKDMIISGGENVYSLEVENAIAMHPAVAQCAVIGLPDEKWGERVHAVVQLVPGSSLEIDELREFCKRSIAGYKSPQSMEVVERWPLSAAGKILKGELRAGFALPRR